MNNPSLYQDSSKKYSIWKRLFTFIVDGLMTVILLTCLFFSLGTLIISNVSKNDINAINEMYVEICNEENLPYKKEIYGFYRLDEAKYIKILINDGYSEDKAGELSNEKYQKIDELLTLKDGYKTYYQKFHATYFITLFSFTALSTFIFEFLIPILNKKHQTLAMMMFKSCLVNKDNIITSNIGIVIRYFFITIIEFLMIYLIFGLVGIIFETLIMFILISFTRNRLTFHDAIIRAHLVDVKEAFSE